MKHFFLICAALAAFACGDAQEDVDTAGDEIELDLAQWRAGITAPAGPAMGAETGYGFSSGSSNLHCNTTNLGQSCFVPGWPSKNVTYCLGNAFSAAEKASLRTGIANVDAGVVYQFVENTVGCQLTITDDVGPSTPLSTSLSRYAKAGPFSTFVLADGATPGTWTRFGGLQCFVDRIDLGIKAAQMGGQAGLNAWKHVGGRCAGFAMGLGSRSAAGSTGTSSFSAMRPDFLNTNVLGVTAGEQCLTSGFSPLNNTSFSFVGLCPFQ